MENRTCPKCGAEYEPQVETCADCHRPLMSASELSAARSSLESAENLALIRREEPNWIKAFADELDRAGIPTLIKVEHQSAPSDALGSFGQGWIYGIYVRPEDESHARALDERHWAKLLGDDAPATETCEESSQRCPACGTWVGVGAQECPSCGLFLAVE